MEDKKEEEKKEEKKEKGGKKENNNDKDTLTEKEQRALLDQILKLEQENTKPAHRKNEIKDKYEFWETQPVAQFNKDAPVEFGEIFKNKLCRR